MHKVDLERDIPAAIYTELRRCIRTLRPYENDGVRMAISGARPTDIDRLAFVAACIAHSEATATRVVIGEVDYQPKHYSGKTKVEAEKQVRLLVARGYNLGFEYLPEDWNKLARVISPDLIVDRTKLGIDNPKS